MTNTAPIFYASAAKACSDHRADTPPVIKIIFGQTGYYPCPEIPTVELADKLNEMNGTTPAAVEAAIICSMFDCWQNFDKITADHQE